MNSHLLNYVNMNVFGYIRFCQVIIYTKVKKQFFFGTLAFVRLLSIQKLNSFIINNKHIIF